MTMPANGRKSNGREITRNAPIRVLSHQQPNPASIAREHSRRATMPPRGPAMKNDQRYLGGTGGGLSHSSTYGCHQSAPLPRDWMVCSYARSRAMRMLRERKK